MRRFTGRSSSGSDDAPIAAAVMTNLADHLLLAGHYPNDAKRQSYHQHSSETVGLPTPMFSLYQSSKAGLSGFTEHSTPSWSPTASG